MGWKIDQMEASVAPPRLKSWQPGSALRMRSGSATGIQSPLSITSRRPASSAAALFRSALRRSESISSASAGTEFQTVHAVAGRPRPRRWGSGCRGGRNDNRAASA